jgi:hypothetical protein
MNVKEMFKKYPQEEPNFNGTNYLTITDNEGILSYSITYYNKEAEFEPKHGKVVAFTEKDPKFIINTL